MGPGASGGATMSLCAASMGRHTRTKPYRATQAANVNEMTYESRFAMSSVAAKAHMTIERNAAIFSVPGPGSVEDARHAGDIKMGVLLGIQRRQAVQLIEKEGGLPIGQLGGTYGTMHRMKSAHDQLHDIGRDSENIGRGEGRTKRFKTKKKKHDGLAVDKQTFDEQTFDRIYAKNAVLPKRDNIAASKVRNTIKPFNPVAVFFLLPRLFPDTPYRSFGSIKRRPKPIRGMRQRCSMRCDQTELRQFAPWAWQ